MHWVLRSRRFECVRLVVGVVAAEFSDLLSGLADSSFHLHLCTDADAAVQVGIAELGSQLIFGSLKVNGHAGCGLLVACGTEESGGDFGVLETVEEHHHVGEGGHEVGEGAASV